MQIEDEEQSSAVEASLDGATLVDAGAGSGKTTTTTRRVKHLLDSGIAPIGILAVSFSRLSAASLSERIVQAVEGGKGGQPLLGLADMAVGTFHSVAVRLLKSHVHRFKKWEMLSETKRRVLVRLYYRWLGVSAVAGVAKNKRARVQGIKLYLSALDRLREECVPDADIPAPLRVALVKYRELLALKTHWDYSEVLCDFHAAIAPTAVSPYATSQDAMPESQGLLAHLRQNLRALLVDESQDLNTIMWQIIYRLAEAGGEAVSLWIVGDEAQTVYSWRGAVPDGFARFVEQFPQTRRYTLSSNYRSQPGIVALATRFLQESRGVDNPPPKSLIARSHHELEEGDIAALRFSTSAEQYRWGAERFRTLLGVPYRDRIGSAPRGLAQSDFAVLVRSKKSIAPVVAALRAAGLEAVVKGEGGLLAAPESIALATAVYYMAGLASREQLETCLSRCGIAFPPDCIERAVVVLGKVRTRIDTERMAQTPPGGEAAPFTPVCLVRILYNFLACLKYSDDFLREVAPSRASLIQYNISRVLNAVADFQHWYYRFPLARKVTDLAVWLRDEAEDTCDDGDNDESQSIATVTHNAVTVSTIHAAKGLEWAAVWIPDLAEGVFPAVERPTGLRKVFGQANVFDLGRFDTKKSDEDKVFYVAITRAAKYLFLTHAPIATQNRRPSRTSSYLTTIAATEIATDDKALLPVSARVEASQKLPATPRREQHALTLTFSQLFYYFLCPHQFYLRFVLGFPPPVSPVIGYPKALHDGAAELDKRLSTGETLQGLDFQEIAERHFKMPFASQGEKIERLAAAREALSEYARCYQTADGKTEFVEQEVRLDIGDITILGRIDRSYFTTEGKLRIVEHKTSHEATERDTDMIQLQVYAAAHQAQTGRLADEVAVNLIGVEGAGEQEYTVASDQIEAVKHRVAEAGENISAGRFVADPAPVKSETPNSKTTCGKCDVRYICSRYQREKG